MPKAEGHMVLTALADAIAAATALARPAAPSLAERCALWVHDADETLCPAERGEYSVLRSFASPPVDAEPNRLAVQASARGTTHKRALVHAELIANALLDGTEGEEDRRPRKAWLVGAAPSQFTIDLFEVSEPVLIGRDDKGWSDVVVNFEFCYRRVTAL